jgi:hypothetical protein
MVMSGSYTAVATIPAGETGVAGSAGSRLEAPGDLSTAVIH